MSAAPSTWTCPTCGNAYPSDFSVCPRDATPRADGVGQITDPLIGEVLARTYRLVRVLGEGGMARLYEAEHLRVETHYAVKVIHEDLARVPDLLVRFEREARAAGRIRSDHVVRVIDVLRTTDGRPCIVTELLQGEDLQAHLNKVGKLAPFDAIPIARQICRALAAAHEVGVVHRDLKPSNVFLCNGPERMIKVFDFGVAKLEDDEKLTRTDAVMGTPAYMAPEQARRAADAGPLADLYTCGAVLYHMLTGEPPYGKAPATSRLALVLHEEPARPRAIEPSIPEGLEAVVQHAMARDPASRVQSALELDAELAVFDTIAQGTASAASVEPRAALEIGATAEEISKRARIARPSAAGLVAGSSLAAGLCVGVLIAAIVAPGAALTGTEQSLIALLTAAMAMGVAMLQIRVLRPRWSSIPAVWAHARWIGRALVAGLATLGAFELLARGVATLAQTGDGGIAWRAAAGALAATIALVVQRRRRRR